MSALPFDYDTPATPTGAAGRRCARHDWAVVSAAQSRYEDDRYKCRRCGAIRDDTAARRGRNNRKRGGSWEREAAADIGGIRMGQLNLPWDVEVAGYVRVQTKQLDRWPSLTAVLAMLDAIPAGQDLRAVALKDTPGPGRRARKIVVMDWSEYCQWHGRRP